MNEISKAAAAARSALHEKLRQQRVFATQGPQHKHRPTAVNKSEHALMPAHPDDITARKETSRSIEERESSETSPGTRSATPSKTRQPIIDSTLLNNTGLCSLANSCYFLIYFVVWVKP